MRLKSGSVPLASLQVSNCIGDRQRLWFIEHDPGRSWPHGIEKATPSQRGGWLAERGGFQRGEAEIFIRCRDKPSAVLIQPSQLSVIDLTEQLHVDALPGTQLAREWTGSDDDQTLSR